MINERNNSGAGERRLRILTAVKFILKASQNELSPEMYGSIGRLYGVLLEILEKGPALEEVAHYMSLPPEKVMICADNLVAYMMFNIEDDPFISLGLPQNSGSAEIEKRRRRLLMLYHPDRASGQGDFSERARKINEAFEKAIRNAGLFRSRASCRESFGGRTAFARSRHRKTLRTRLRRKIPLFLITLIIAAAVISFLLLIYSRTDQSGASVGMSRYVPDRNGHVVILVPLSADSARVLRIESLDRGAKEILYENKPPKPDRGNGSPPIPFDIEILPPDLPDVK